MERETQERQGGAEGSGARKGKGRGKVERKGKKGRTTEEGEKMDWGLSVRVSWPVSLLAHASTHVNTGVRPQTHIFAQA